MAAEVGASPADIWRRLVDPEALARWHPGAVGPAVADAGWPRPGARRRLRTRRGRLPLELRETVLEAVPRRRLRCDVRLGLHRFEACFTLAAERGGRRTRLGLRVVTASQVPLVGGALDRFATRRLVAEVAAAWLEGLSRLEAGDAPAPPSAGTRTPAGPGTLSPARSPRAGAAPPPRPPPSRPGG
ncbi:MAG: SRPBCC family protein [Myxococcota bacterium]|nr:SRPBCC family protein [Myxococcota bacterium]